MRIHLAAGLLALLNSILWAGEWVEIARDPLGGRRGSAIRWAEQEQRFLLWGFMTPSSDLLQEHPLMEIPEYDVVALDPAAGKWMNHLPPGQEKEWSKKLPPAYIPRTYSALTTGSERTVMRNATDDAPAVPRPDLNIVFDQVAYRPTDNSLYYFTGGLTARYDVGRRRWRDMRPLHSPPPVAGGSLAYDPVHDEFVLFGGGHVAEMGTDGKLRGYTGTWVYKVKENDWVQLSLAVRPPPRMVTRLVTDTKRNQLILFGGDGHRYYYGDTWIFDLPARRWRQSAAKAGPPPRAGHFTAFDPETGYVFIGGGYNRQDLADMWAFDPAADRWMAVDGAVPTGFYITADLAARTRELILVTNTKTPGDRATCNEIFPVRTTYRYRLNEAKFGPAATVEQQAMPKRAPQASPAGQTPGPVAENQWTELANPGRVAAARTWGSATFDSKRRQILYWGGGHCGYEGSDTDAYDVARHTWIAEPQPPSYPERLWNRASRLAGVTFDGEPWTDHGRRIYAYDSVADRMVMVKPVRFTAGYEPEWSKRFPARRAAAADAVVQTPSSYTRFVTFSYDLNARQWSVAGPAPEGLDTLVSTPLGVMAIPVNWPARLNDAGYQATWDPRKVEDNAVYLWKANQWQRLSKPGPSPQNLYEMTSLAFDTKRNQLILHGAGADRRDVWIFDVANGKWQPRKTQGEAPPACLREAVYMPGADVMLTYGSGLWEYAPATNRWRRLPIAEPRVRAGQNRAMVYDAAADTVLLVLGGAGDQGKATVFGMRYRP
ncbi:MAG: hypothetical protein IT168_09560 [Bryobacterales bacterium]|nr:hypothetical protein [Bryobacterales bacterium]